MTPKENVKTEQREAKNGTMVDRGFISVATPPKLDFL